MLTDQRSKQSILEEIDTTAHVLPDIQKKEDYIFLVTLTWQTTYVLQYLMVISLGQGNKVD